MCIAGISMLVFPFLPYIGTEYTVAKRWFYILGSPVYAGLFTVLFSIPLLVDIVTKIEDNEAKAVHYINFILIILTIDAIFLMQADLPMLVLINLIMMFMLLKKENLRKKIMIALLIILPIATVSGHKYLLRPYVVENALSAYYYTHDKYWNGYQTKMAMIDIHAGGLFGSGFGYYGSLRGFDAYNYNMLHMISRFVLQITGRQFGMAGIALIVITNPAHSYFHL